jgi:hypothetical protein
VSKLNLKGRRRLSSLPIRSEREPNLEFRGTSINGMLKALGEGCGELVKFMIVCSKRAIPQELKCRITR